MTRKRKNRSYSSYSGTSTNQKRLRPSVSAVDEVDVPFTANGVQPSLDPTYGQRGAFPGLDEAEEDENVFYAPASDGLEYLRMVR